MKDEIGINNIIPELDLIVDNYAYQISRFKIFYQEDGGNFGTLLKKIINLFTCCIYV